MNDWLKREQSVPPSRSEARPGCGNLSFDGRSCVRAWNRIACCAQSVQPQFAEPPNGGLVRENGNLDKKRTVVAIRSVWVDALVAALRLFQATRRLC